MIGTFPSPQKFPHAANPLSPHLIIFKATQFCFGQVPGYRSKDRN